MRMQSSFKCFFRLMLTILFITFFANCAGSGNKEMKELLSKDDAEEDLLSEENLTDEAFDENEDDSLMSAEDSLEEEKVEDTVMAEDNLDKKAEKNDELLSLENPSDLNNVEINKLDDFDPVEEVVSPVELEKVEKTNDLAGRVVRYVKIDCDVYDASKSKVIGSFKKGEPVVVSLGTDGWGMLSESHFIKVENLSVKGVGRVRR